jgi:hypothetical protein
LADWYRRAEHFGGNAELYCNGCAPLNMLLDLEDKLTAHLLSQSDDELRQLGDAFSTRRETRKEREGDERREVVGLGTGR